VEDQLELQIRVRSEPLQHVQHHSRGTLFPGVVTDRENPQTHRNLRISAEEPLATAPTGLVQVARANKTAALR